MKSKIIPVRSVCTHFADRLALTTLKIRNRAESTCAGILRYFNLAIIHNLICEYSPSFAYQKCCIKTSPSRNSKYNVDGPLNSDRVFGVIYEPEYSNTTALNRTNYTYRNNKNLPCHPRQVGHPESISFLEAWHI